MKAVKRILVLLVFCLLLSPMQVGLCSSVVSQLESFSELEALLTKLDSLSKSVDSEIDEKADLTKASATAVEDSSEDTSDLSQLSQLKQLIQVKKQLATLKSKLGTTKSSLSTTNKSLSGLTDDLKTRILKATLQSDSLGIVALSALLKIV